METARACAAAAGGAGQSAVGSPACREVPRRGGASRVGGELRERAARVKRRGRLAVAFAFLRLPYKCSSVCFFLSWLYSSVRRPLEMHPLSPTSFV